MVVHSWRTCYLLVDGADSARLLAHGLRVCLQGRESMVSSCGLSLMLPILGLIVLPAGCLREVVRCLARDGRYNNRRLRVVGRLSCGHVRASWRRNGSLCRILHDTVL